jgi:hypothetical protein
MYKFMELQFVHNHQPSYLHLFIGKNCLYIQFQGMNIHWKHIEKLHVFTLNVRTRFIYI